MQTFNRIFFVALAALTLLSGCAAHNPKMWEPAQFPKATPATNKLKTLPSAGQKVAVAVYGFTDQTGQFKPTDGAQTLSRAVTQGATSILVKSLHEAGQRSWFTVIEREKLDNVLRERAVIREMRASYLGEKNLNPQALPPLLFAGVLLEGGIIGYDSNTKSGGSGARFLGIGGQTQYREDTVTVYLRAVSVKTGEVLSSVSMRKSIASVAVGASAFRYVAFKELIELETGITYNEPDQLALQQTIEASVYALIMEGAMQDLWCFSTSSEEGAGLLRSYIAERDSISSTKVQLPLSASGNPVTGTCQSDQIVSSPKSRRSQQVAVEIRAKPPASTRQFNLVAAPKSQSENSNQILTRQPESAGASEVNRSINLNAKNDETNAAQTPARAQVLSPATTASQPLQKLVAKNDPQVSEQNLQLSAPVSSANRAVSEQADIALSAPSSVQQAPAPKQRKIVFAEAKEVLSAIRPVVSLKNISGETPCGSVYLTNDVLPAGYTPSVPAPAECGGSEKFETTATKVKSTDHQIKDAPAPTQSTSSSLPTIVASKGATGMD